MNKNRKLAELKFYIDMADKSCREYVNNNSKYLNALIIRKYNLEIRSLIITLVNYFPEEIQKGCITLCYHFDTWLILFENLEKLSSLSLNDEFIFQSNVPFPIDAVNKLKSFTFDASSMV